MKVLAEIGKRARAAGEALGILDIEKREGIFVSRPLEPRNAKKWHDWAVKHGVPNPLPASELHVTIIYSKEKDAKVPLAETVLNIPTSTTWSPGFFAMFGQEEEHLVFTFWNYELHDRHWAFLQAGCVCEWPTYRPHITLSSEAQGFELSDEALQDVPAYIILMPEVSAAPRQKSADLQKFGGEDDSLLEVSDVAKTTAAEYLKANAEKVSALDALDLADIAHGRLCKGVAKRLAGFDWVPGEVKACFGQAESKVRKRAQKDITISVSNLPEEISKALKDKDIAKSNDEEQIVMGIASVSTVKGELVTDAHDDQITTKALVEFNRSLIAGGREGKLMHEGEACTEVVAGLVLTEDWQKALGIDLGFEPYLVEIHVPDAELWAEVKKGDWMLSIAGTMWYWDEEGADA